MREWEQRVAGDATIEALLRFVQLNSERALAQAAANGWFRQEGAVSPCARAHCPVHKHAVGQATSWELA